MEQDEKKKDPSQKSSFMSDALSFIKVFVISAAVILLFVNFIAHPVTVEGRSMVPTLQDGEYGFTSILSAKTSKPQRGEVVVVDMEENGKQAYWVKRIIGMPNETVSIKDGVVYINDEALDESAYMDEEYVQSMIDQYGYFMEDMEPVTLKDNEYFVMGDNRIVSKDSRNPAVGPVQESQIYGKGVFVLFPFSEMGLH